MGHHSIGLRGQHFEDILSNGLQLGLVEAISENFMGRGGRPLAVLERVRRDSPVALHGVSLSIGGLDPIEPTYLRELRTLADRIDAAWVSDHFCFRTFGGHVGHDLWPLPFTEESVRNVVERVSRVQDALGRRLVLEAVSSYVEFTDSTMTEWEFISEVLHRADCELLLDLNNLHINATNHGYDAHAALLSIPSRRIRQLHFAGHADLGTHLFDTHGAPVSDAVWGLFVECVRVHGPRPTIIEWDQDVPPLDRVLAESRRAEEFEAAALASRALPLAVGT
jgi:uncharacterized protein (UPF0276 family)